MSIKVLTLVEEKARRFGASQSSSTFQQLIVDCANYVIGDIESELGISVDAVTSYNDTIDLDEQTYKGLFSLGIDYYVNDDGQWTTSTPERIKAQYDRRLERVKRDYWISQAVVTKIGDLSD